MAHPHKAEAHSSSREKFKAITGHAGGGHAYHGGSHLKKAGHHGVLKHWSGHHKTHLEGEHAHGRRAKARADKYARGGRTEENESFKVENKGAAPKRAAPGMISTKAAGWYKNLERKGNPDPGYHSGMSDDDLRGMYEKRGGRTSKKRYARGGQVKGSPREVNVTIQMTPPGADGKPMMAPPMPPPAPAPAPMPPPNPGMGAGMPGAPGAPGGANPMQALGKGMGFKRGGRTALNGALKSAPAINVVNKKRHQSKTGRTDIGHGVKPAIGDTPYDLGHWAHYSAQGTPIKQTDRDYRARGGRTSLPNAGAMTGVGRLEQYHKAKRLVSGR